MSNIAIIPARGGSKRLSEKNILDFQGRPIIQWTLEAAYVADIFEKIIVSSDHERIKEIAKKNRAEVHTRDHDLSSDEARVVDVCLSVLDEEEHNGREYDIVYCLYPTAALRTSDDIIKLSEIMKSEQYDFAMAVTNYDVPPHQALIKNDDASLHAMWPELVNKREDEIGQIVVDNGSTYAARVEKFRKYRTFYGPKLGGHLMPKIRSVDINTVDDFELAKFYASRIAK